MPNELGVNFARFLSVRFVAQRLIRTARV